MFKTAFQNTLKRVKNFVIEAGPGLSFGVGIYVWGKFLIIYSQAYSISNFIFINRTSFLTTGEWKYEQLALAHRDQISVQEKNPRENEEGEEAEGK